MQAPGAYSKGGDLPTWPHELPKLTIRDLGVCEILQGCGKQRIMRRLYSPPYKWDIIRVEWQLVTTPMTVHVVPIHRII